MLLPWYFVYIATFLTRGINGWYVVLKVGGQGLANDVTLAELWTDNDVLNEDQAAIVQDTYTIKDMPSYKSNIINIQWNIVRLTKIGVYKDGAEAAYFIFNSTSTNKTSWFSSSKIMETSYPDLRQPQAKCVLHHYNTTRSFAIISSSETANCTLFSGWLMTVDDGASSKCHWEYGHHKPFFLYSQRNQAVPFHNGSSVADSFVVFVDDCVSGPCQHDGTCTPSKDDYTCHCTDQLYGKNCHVNCPCQAGKCVSITQDDITTDGVIFNGTLINKEPVYPTPGVMVACQCDSGIEGAYCNQSIDDCVLHSCINGGVCIDGDNSYRCNCPVGFSGDRCQISEKSFKGHTDKDSMVAKVALGVVIPVIVLLVAAIIVYGVYMYRHPDKFGRSATYKNYVIAREFVRRSIRRMSGRRPRQKLSENGNAMENKENEASQSDKKHVDASHVNLGFQEGDERQYKAAVPVYKRENSEFYNLSPTDAAVVAGPEAYEMGQRRQEEDAHHQVDNKAKKPRQLGRAYRNKSNSSAPRSPSGVQPSPLTPGNTPQQPEPSPRTPGTSSTNSAPSPRTPDVKAYPAGHSQSPYQKDNRAVRSAPDEEDFGFKPIQQTESSSKHPSTSSYSSADRFNPEHRRQEPRPDNTGYDVRQPQTLQLPYDRHGVPQKYADDRYNDRYDDRYDDRATVGDPRPYNTPHTGHNVGGRSAHPRNDMYNAAQSPRDKYVERPSPVDPRDRYNSRQAPQERHEGRRQDVNPSDRYNSPHGDRSPGDYPRNPPSDRYNTDHVTPSHDRYNTPRTDPADRYNDRYREDYQPSKSPRYAGPEQPQYDHRHQRSPNQISSEHARIVFPPSDGMDEVTI